MPAARSGKTREALSVANRVHVPSGPGQSRPENCADKGAKVGASQRGKSRGAGIDGALASAELRCKADDATISGAAVAIEGAVVFLGSERPGDLVGDVIDNVVDYSSDFDAVYEYFAEYWRA